MSNIVINADDLGLCHSVNTAIIELFDKRIINSATLMANMSGFDEAVALVHERKLEKSIGVHLVLTEGLPLTVEIKSLDYLFNSMPLLAKDRFKKLFFIRKRDQEVIFREFSAQIEKVRKNGISITHLDTHHQIHDSWGILVITLKLLKTYNIPTVRIHNNLSRSQFSYKNHYRDLMIKYLKLHKVNFSDFFGNQIDFLGRFEKNSLFFYNKTLEIMVHPDINNNGKIIDKVMGKEYDFEFQKYIDCL